eukprot:g3306.t1
MEEERNAEFIHFLRICGRLKDLRRTGWVANDVIAAETVASHMYRMAMGAICLGAGGVDKSKSGIFGSAIDLQRCIKIALVHDLAEAIVGDITPHDGVSEADKEIAERRAILDIRKRLNKVGLAGTEIYQLWDEYEKAQTPEAKFVKDMDKFDMELQAMEYEFENRTENSLKDFYGKKRLWKTNFMASVKATLERQRASNAWAEREDFFVDTPGQWTGQGPLLKSVAENSSANENSGRKSKPTTSQKQSFTKMHILGCTAIGFFAGALFSYAFSSRDTNDQKS